MNICFVGTWFERTKTSRRLEVWPFIGKLLSSTLQGVLLDFFLINFTQFVILIIVNFGLATVRSERVNGQIITAFWTFNSFPEILQPDRISPRLRPRYFSSYIPQTSFLCIFRWKRLFTHAYYKRSALLSSICFHKWDTCCILVVESSAKRIASSEIITSRLCDEIAYGDSSLPKIITFSVSRHEIESRKSRGFCTPNWYLGEYIPWVLFFQWKLLGGFFPNSSETSYTITQGAGGLFERWEGR